MIVGHFDPELAQAFVGAKSEVDLPNGVLRHHGELSTSSEGQSSYNNRRLAEHLSYFGLEHVLPIDYPMISGGLDFSTRAQYLPTFLARQDVPVGSDDRRWHIDKSPAVYKGDITKPQKLVRSDELSNIHLGFSSHPPDIVVGRVKTPFDLRKEQERGLKWLHMSEEGQEAVESALQRGDAYKYEYDGIKNPQGLVVLTIDENIHRLDPSLKKDEPKFRYSFKLPLPNKKDYRKIRRQLDKDKK